MASAVLSTSNIGARWRFTLAILAGSFLLFLIQPMVARMALPRLGGAPAVWNSAMLVYQALLLAGYAYAHALGRLPLRGQALVHLALLLLAAAMLPIGLVAAMPSPNANPFLWTPWLLVVSIGPLFFVVAAQAPLLQRWFAARGGGDPYPLYAASNLGSFAGLIAYPLLLEPFLALRAQSWLWTAGYLLVILLVATCALTLRAAVDGDHDPVTARTRLKPGLVLHWIALAAVPSGLLLSTTTHLTTDIVAVPLLWVLPLGLYLLSFTVAFAASRRGARSIATVAALVILIGGGTTFAENPEYPWIFAPLGLILLFVVSVTLHGVLYDRRPDPSQLTAFYLIMSFGGVLGGLFCALIAPLVFDWGYEHPLLILAAALLTPQRALFGFTARLWADPGRNPLIIGLVALLISMASGGMFGFIPDPVPTWIKLVATLIVINLSIAALGNRIAFTLCLGAMMLTLGGWKNIKTSLIHQARVRSYFGVYSVGNAPGPARMLVHGTTIHGLQDLRPGHERDPLSYYAPNSGVGFAMRLLATDFPAARVGIVGLGSGTLACYARSGQDWRFYEIDPAMAEIARDPHRFSFLARCTPGVAIKIGDARMTLASEPAAGLDMLVIDAFSSDAVPMHLLTREAFDVYGRRLTASGLLMVHISNRFIDLEPVVAARVGDGWHLAVRDYAPTREEMRRGMSESLWIAMSHDPARIARLVSATGPQKWRAVRPRAGFDGWTDDHGSILPLLHFRKPK